jgi:hypothetical protein
MRAASLDGIVVRIVDQPTILTASPAFERNFYRDGTMAVAPTAQPVVACTSA